MPDPAYGYRHQLQRGAAMAVLADGTPCPACGLGMYRDKTPISRKESLSNCTGSVQDCAEISRRL
jgi:hypothetical protein